MLHWISHFFTIISYQPYKKIFVTYTTSISVLGVVAIEKGAVESPFATVANLTLYPNQGEFPLFCGLCTGLWYCCEWVWLIWFLCLMAYQPL